MRNDKHELIQKKLVAAALFIQKPQSLILKNFAQKL